MSCLSWHIFVGTKYSKHHREDCTSKGANDVFKWQIDHLGSLVAFLNEEGAEAQTVAKDLSF